MIDVIYEGCTSYSGTWCYRNGELFLPPRGTLLPGGRQYLRWGNMSGGAQNLAWCLLNDATGKRSIAEKLFLAFTLEIVSLWPEGRIWQTTRAEILAWIQGKENPPAKANIEEPKQEEPEKIKPVEPVPIQPVDQRTPRRKKE